MEDYEAKVVKGIADLSEAICKGIKETKREGVMIATVYTLVQAVYALVTYDFDQRSRECVTFVRDFANDFKKSADHFYEEVMEDDRDSMVQ